MTSPQLPGSAVAKTWVGGMSLDALAEGLRLNQVASGQQSVDTQRFWASPSRDASSTEREVIQITLTTARRLNEIEFDLAAFPHDVYAEFYDEQTGAWSPCLDDTFSTPEAVAYSVRDSVPAVLPPASAVTGHLHPQHSFTGHWRTVIFKIRPIYTKTLRLVLSRSERGTPPTNAQGLLVPYSLAIRNLKLSYSIRKLSDVPWTTPGQGEQRDTFATTTDVFGSPVDFQVRVNVASNAIGATKGVNGLTTVWKSEPQPIPWAVVNFYVDARDDAGEAQTLDRFFLEPLYEGPTCNLYWSNSEPTDRFRSNADPIPPVIASVNNSAGVTGNVLNFSNPALDDAIAFVELDNRGIAFDPTKPWWLGGKLNFKFKHGTQAYDAPIFDCGAFNLTWTPLGPRLTTSAGDSVLVRTETDPPGLVMDQVDVNGEPVPTEDWDPVFVGFDPATPVSFMAWGDGSTIGVAIRFGVNKFVGTMPQSAATLAKVTTMRVGAFLGSSPGSARSRMQALLLKIDTTPSAEEIDDFLRDPLPYVLNSEYLGTNDPRTDNALFRYHPEFYSIDFPAAFVGGAPDRYAYMDWHPIARNYILRKGYLYFPPTRAKRWKLEFTNLSPQNYEVYRPVDKTVAVFPSEQWRKAIPSGAAPTSAAGLAELMPGRDNIYVVNTLTQTLDNGRSAIVGTNAPKSNTTARVIYDNEVRAKVSEAYWAWSFMPTHSTGISPSWESTGRHHYQVIDYQATRKLSYFVGLRSIGAFKLNYISTDDTPQYDEPFYDLANVAEGGNWVLSEDHLLTSGSAAYAEVKSKVFSSNRVVTAIQFAAQQSDPDQLLPDSDLADPEMRSWDAVGDAVLSDTSGEDPALATTKRINRSQPPLTWGRVQAGYPLWGDPVALNASWGAVLTGTQIPGETGGISSKPITLPLGGRVHIAARAIAEKDLTLPLSVQLVNVVDGRVLADADATVKAGKVVEWYADYTIGEGAEPVPWLWGDFARSGYSDQGLTATFSGPNVSTLPPFDGGQSWLWPVDSNGNESSLDIVSSAATVTAEGQQNWVDTGNPWGTLTATLGTTGTTVAGVVALLRLDPMFITETGALKVWSGSTVPASRGFVLGAGNTSYTVQPGDAIRVDFLPAHLVPSDKLDSTGNQYDQYAMMFWVNGVWKATRTHNYGASPVKGIKGRLDQKFTKVSWTPVSYGRIPGALIQGMPRLGNGGWADSTVQQTWKDGNGREWFVGSSDPAATTTASWNPTSPVERVGMLNADVTATVSTNKLAVGAAQLVGLAVRYDGVNTGYVGRAEFNTNQTVTARLLRIDSAGTETSIATVTTVAGLTHAAGTAFKMRLQIIGATLQFKVWLASSAEPGIWTVTAGSATVISNPGFVATFSKLTSGTTNAPVQVTWDDVIMLHPGTSTVLASHGFVDPVTSGWGDAWLTAGGVPADYNVTSGSATVSITSAGTPPRLAYTGALSDEVGATLTAASDNAVFWTDVEQWNGNLTFRLRRIAGTAGQTDPAGRRGKIVCLDFDAEIYIDASGSIVEGNAILQSGFIPGGVPLNKDITIVFADSKLFNPASTAGRQIYAVIDGVTVGTANAFSVALSTGTKRGLAGAVYSGTRPAGPAYAIDTSFQSFNWSPNALLISTTASEPTWSSATRNATLTYGEVLAQRDTYRMQVYARVVQQGASKDVWDVDSIVLYADPIVWSFSNDGGYVFSPAYEIRNNPTGVLVFPQISAINLVQKPGNALVWRAVSYRPGAIISNLTIRPWYGGMFSGVDHRASLTSVSPNLMPYDQYGDIRKDSRFQTWSLPIPRSWWYASQVLNRMAIPGPPIEA